MKVYLKVFVKFKQKNKVKLLLIAEFIYDNTKNDTIWYISFKLIYRSHLYILFKKDINLFPKSKLVDKLANKLKNLINIYENKFDHI